MATERLTFVWIIRDIGNSVTSLLVISRLSYVLTDQIEWIRPQLEQALLLAPKDFLHVKIYCTRLAPPKEGSKAVSLEGADIISGRPDFPSLIEETLAASDYTDWVSISVCGPTKMAADLAEAASNAIQPSQVLKGEHRVRQSLSHSINAASSAYSYSVTYTFIKRNS